MLELEDIQKKPKPNDLFNEYNKTSFGKTKKGLDMTSLDEFVQMKTTSLLAIKALRAPEGEPVGIEFDEGHKMVIKLFSTYTFLKTNIICRFP